MKRKILLSLTFVFCICAHAFSGTEYSGGVKSTINEFFTLRMNLSLCPTPQDALLKIEDFKKEHSVIFSSASEEEKLTLQNLYALEEYNYQNMIEENAASTKKAIAARHKENEAYLNAHHGEKANKWFLTTSADIISVNMSFDPVRTAVKHGLSVKKHYEEALLDDADFSYALTNLAQWYYFAPKIAGGGKAKAKSFFEKALEAAKTDAEKYFALIFLSQVAFDEGRKDRSQEFLLQADTFAPGGSFVRRLSHLNENGHSYFSRNSSKYE